MLKQREKTMQYSGSFYFQKRLIYGRRNSSKRPESTKTLLKIKEIKICRFHHLKEYNLTS